MAMQMITCTFLIKKEILLEFQGGMPPTTFFISQELLGLTILFLRIICLQKDTDSLVIMLATEH